MTTTSIKNIKSILIKPRFSLVSVCLKKWSLSEANNKTMPMFIKLLATKIVASSFLGFFSSFVMVSMILESVSSPVLKSLWLIENNATSAPDISAEQNSSIKSKIIPRR